MKLHYGAIPEDPSFQPAAQGWSSIKEPGPALLQVVVLPIALATAALLVACLFWILPRGVYMSGGATIQISIWLPFAVLLLMIPVHELLHALCTPQWGMSEKTLIGIWPQKLLFYAYYAGTLSRNRFLLIQLTPFLVLSLLPLLIIAASRSSALDIGLFSFLVVLSVLNGVASSGDLLGAGLILFQIPGKADIRNLGWRTFWKSAAENG
jgi:hypothetical protein